MFNTCHPSMDVSGAGNRQTPAVLPVVCCASHLLHVRRPVCSKENGYWISSPAYVQNWTQFRCTAERSRYQVAARRLLAVLERSEERKIDSSDLARLVPGVSGCFAILEPESCSLIIAATPCCSPWWIEAQHSCAYMMRWHL
jgi:hypothetical protein